MKIDVLTLFPDMFLEVFEHSIIKKAQSLKKVEIQVHNFRDYAFDKHQQVDDYQVGGGPGMVLKPEPIYLAVEALRKLETKVILLTPQGQLYDQKRAYDLAKEKHLIIICGHYEGFDERILDLVDYEISIGDYVLTGGEIPAMVLVDSVVRLLPGVIQEESHLTDSFTDGLLDYPVYTKPIDFRGMKVPEILLSGHHQKIATWRREKQIEKTKQKRPDLWEKRRIDEKI